MRLVSPVFSKEMVTLARRGWQYFARAAVLGVLLAMIMISWQVSSQVMGQGFRDLSYLGRMLFTAFAYTQLLIVIFLTPALTAPVIAEEKDRNTLGLLLMSNLRHHNIVMDKLLSRMLLMGLLLLSGLPLFLVLLAFRGITPGQPFIVFTVIISTMLFCSGVGVLISSLTTKIHTALLTTYGILAAYAVGLVCAQEADLIRGRTIRYLLPIDLVDMRLQHCLVFAAVAILVFTSSLLLSVKLLPIMVGPKRPHMLKRLFSLMNAFFHRINFTGVVVLEDDRVLKSNAIMWKETHKRFFSSNVFLFRMFYVLLATSMIALTVMDWGDRASFLIAAWAGLILLTAAAIVSSASAFTGEREKHSFEILMTSPLTAKSVVLAKFVGAIRPAIPLAAFVILWFWISLCWPRYSGYRSWQRRPYTDIWLGLSIVIASYLPVIIAIGLNVSARRKSTAVAIFATFLFCSIWSLLPTIPLLLDTFHVIEIPSSALDWFMSLTPLTAIMMVFERDLSITACLLSVPCWIFLLVSLIVRFDKIIGRQ